jgi:hypothetical protein
VSCSTARATQRNPVSKNQKKKKKKKREREREREREKCQDYLIVLYFYFSFKIFFLVPASYAGSQKPEEWMGILGNSLLIFY